MCKRVSGQIDAIKSPIGYLPKEGALGAGSGVVETAMVMVGRIVTLIEMLKVAMVLKIMIVLNDADDDLDTTMTHILRRHRYEWSGGQVQVGRAL